MQPNTEWLLCSIKAHLTSNMKSFFSNSILSIPVQLIQYSIHIPRIRFIQCVVFMHAFVDVSFGTARGFELFGIYNVSVHKRIFYSNRKNQERITIPIPRFRIHTLVFASNSMQICQHEWLDGKPNEEQLTTALFYSPGEFSSCTQSNQIGCVVAVLLPRAVIIYLWSCDIKFSQRHAIVFLCRCFSLLLQYSFVVCRVLLAFILGSLVWKSIVIWLCVCVLYVSLHFRFVFSWLRVNTSVPVSKALISKIEYLRCFASQRMKNEP